MDLETQCELPPTQRFEVTLPESDVQGSTLVPQIEDRAPKRRWSEGGLNGGARQLPISSGQGWWLSPICLEMSILQGRTLQQEREALGLLGTDTTRYRVSLVTKEGILNMTWSFKFPFSVKDAAVLIIHDGLHVQVRTMQEVVDHIDHMQSCLTLSCPQASAQVEGPGIKAQVCNRCPEVLQMQSKVQAASAKPVSHVQGTGAKSTSVAESVSGGCCPSFQEDTHTLPQVESVGAESCLVSQCVRNLPPQVKGAGAMSVPNCCRSSCHEDPQMPLQVQCAGAGPSLEGPCTSSNLEDQQTLLQDKGAEAKSVSDCSCEDPQVQPQARGTGAMPAFGYSCEELQVSPQVGGAGAKSSFGCSCVDSQTQPQVKGAGVNSTIGYSCEDLQMSPQVICAGAKSVFGCCHAGGKSAVGCSYEDMQTPPQVQGAGAKSAFTCCHSCGREDLQMPPQVRGAGAKSTFGCSRVGVKFTVGLQLPPQVRGAGAEFAFGCSRAGVKPTVRRGCENLQMPPQVQGAGAKSAFSCCHSCDREDSQMPPQVTGAGAKSVLVAVVQVSSPPLVCKCRRVRGAGAKSAFGCRHAGVKPAVGCSCENLQMQSQVQGTGAKSVSPQARRAGVKSTLGRSCGTCKCRHRFKVQVPNPPLVAAILVTVRIRKCRHRLQVQVPSPPLLAVVQVSSPPLVCKCRQVRGAGAKSAFGCRHAGVKPAVGCSCENLQMQSQVQGTGAKSASPQARDVRKGAMSALCCSSNVTTG